MKVSCSVITKTIKELSEQLGQSEGYTNNLVSAWQTNSGKFTTYPTIEELKEFKKNHMVGKEVLNVDMSNPIARVTRDLSPMERHDRVVMIAKRFSEIVDGLVEDKIAETEEALNTELSSSNPDINEVSRLTQNLDDYRDSIKGRRNVIVKTTTEAIFDQMREEYQSYADMSVEDLNDEYDGNGEHVKDAYQKVVDNFDVLMDEACVIIEGSENMRLIVERHPFNNGQEVTDKLGANVLETVQEEENQDNATDDDEDGKRADGNGGWSFKVRFVDPHSTLSKGVKKVLSNIVKEGVDGELETDDLGNIRYINEEYAHAMLINELSSMIDSDDFGIKLSDGMYQLYALERIAQKYSWVNQIISELQSNPDLISSFYADFRKDFIPYWMQKDGKSFAMNLPVALDSTMKQITDNYEQKNVLDSEYSVYYPGGVVSKDNATKGEEMITEVIEDLKEGIDEDDYNEIVNKISRGLRMLGLNTNIHIINSLFNTPDGIDKVNQVAQAMRDIFNGVQTMDENNHLIDTFNSEYTTIAKLVGEVSELDNVQSVRQGDKTRYSYSSPNYLDTQFKKFKSDDKRDAYLANQFQKYEWFFNHETGLWRNEWLRQISEDEDVRDQMDLKELVYMGNDWGEAVEYTEWTPDMIREGFINEYFSIGVNKGSKKQFAWYNYPIFSDSPVAKFIKFTRYVGDFKGQLTPLFNQLVQQEMFRIKLVKQRKALGVSEIANFDKNGNKFHFIPKLNTLKINDEKFSDKVFELADEGKIEEMNNLINTAIDIVMTEAFSKFMENSKVSISVITNNLLKSGAIEDKNNIENALEEYFWNQTYATSQIIQLTTTDLAYYKGGTDFQKRYKEVYAAGTKLFIHSKYGREFEKTVYLSDQIITSASFSNIKNVLDAAYNAHKINSYDRENILNKFKDINVADAQAYRSLSSFRAVLDMLGAWTKEMEDSFNRFKEGNWDMSDFNTVWQTIKPFVFTQIEKDSGVPVKTLVDGKIVESNSENYKLKVAHQNKNSEFLLLSMYQMVANSMGNSPKLRAINRFMEDNDIDVIQFESAVKAGKQGTIDLSYSKGKFDTYLMNNPKIAETIKTNRAKKAVSQLDSDSSEAQKKATYDAAYAKPVKYDELKSYYDSLLDKKSISQEEYNNIFDGFELSEQETLDILNENTKGETGEFNPNVVHEIPYEDYVVQQPTPEHLFDVEAVFGSQFRNLIISDMPNDPNFRVNVNGKELTKQEVLDLYQSTIVENLLEDFDKVKAKFGSIEKLQAAMLEQIKGNPKYGRDMINALQIVEVTNPIDGTKDKVFNIPLNNPSTTIKIQELVNATFKNGITKQHIKGGACILVSDFGLTKELKIIFKDANGKVLDRNFMENKSQEEISKAMNAGEISIAGMECYLPAYSKSMYEPFMVTKIDESGNEYQELDINKMPLELRKIIGYRIPTEDKYSMAPLIIKGFLPQQNGSSIMVPADITQIAGSDFDVDKMFLMIPEFKVESVYNLKDAWDAFYNDPNNADIVNEIDANFGEALDKFVKEQTEDWAEAPDSEDIEDFERELKQWLKSNGIRKYSFSKTAQERFKAWFTKDKKAEFFERTVVKKVTSTMEGSDYKSMPRKWNRAQRNNMLIDIAYGILTNSDTASKILNPGNFDLAKTSARIAKISGDKKMLEAFTNMYNLDSSDVDAVAEFMLNMSLDDLDKFVKEFSEELNPLSLDTFIYNHTQNMTGGALIGMYANNTTMQAKFQVLDLRIKPEYQFNIDGVVIDSVSSINSKSGERISKNCANFSAASVDNVKDPVLADLLQNTKTANIAGFMLRAGMSIQEIGLLFTQPVVKKCIYETGGLEKLDKYIDEMFSDLKKRGGSVDANIQNHAYTSKELLSNILRYTRGEYTDDTKAKEIEASQIKAALLMSNIISIANDLKALTKISRADSPNGAIATSIAAAKNQVRAVTLYSRRSKQPNFTLTGMSGIMQNNYIDASMSRDEMRDKLLKSHMPMLQTFYSLGIDLGTKLMAPYFSQTSEYADDMLEELYDNSKSGMLSDKMITTFYDDMLVYGLTKTKMFGNDGLRTFDEKRDYYLYEYPTKFLSVKSNNSDIAELGIFKKMTVQNGEIIMEKSGRLTPTMREALMRDMDTLLYMDNPEAQQLAIDLFMYSFYKDGFKFGPNTYGTFFSTTFMTSFPEFINALREMKYNMNEANYGGFLDQFYANHFSEGIVPEIEEKDVLEGEDEIFVPTSNCLNYVKGDKSVFNKIIYKDNLYVLHRAGKEKSHYKLAAVISDPQGSKYNANMTALEMSEVKVDEKKVEEAKKVNPTKNKGGNIKFPSQEDFDSIFGSMENANIPTGIDDFLASMESYEMDGIEQLENDICIQK